jgi:hypothetical protein
MPRFVLVFVQPPRGSDGHPRSALVIHWTVIEILFLSVVLSSPEYAYGCLSFRLLRWIRISTEIRHVSASGTTAKTMNLKVANAM